MKKHSLALLMAAMVVSGGTFTGCVDNDYDLEDVDYTLQIGSDGTLWVPNSDVFDKVLVDSLLPSSQDDVMKKDILPGTTNDEIYILNADGVDHLTMDLVSAGGVDLNIENQDVELMDVRKQYEIFQNEGTRLDIENPALLLTINNDTHAHIKATLVLSAVDENGEMVKELSGIDLDADPGESQFYLSERKYTAVEEAHYFPQAKWVKFPKNDGETMTQLIYDTPYQLKLEVTKGELRGLEELGTFQRGTVAMGYQLVTPLRFGKDFCLIYSSTLDKWAEDLEDTFEKLDVEGLIGEVTMDNSTPLDLEIEFVPIDKEGNELSFLKFDRATIKAESAGQTVNLKAKNTRYNDGSYSMQQLDGMIFKVYLKGTEQNVGEVLRPTDFFKITNIRLGLQGALIYDAN